VVEQAASAAEAAPVAAMVRSLRRLRFNIRTFYQCFEIQQRTECVLRSEGLLTYAAEYGVV
jgi:hypothetical protein